MEHLQISPYIRLKIISFYTPIQVTLGMFYTLECVYQNIQQNGKKSRIR